MRFFDKEGQKKYFIKGIGHEAMFMQRKHWKYSYLAEKRRNRLCADHEAEVKRFKPLGMLEKILVLLFWNFFLLRLPGLYTSSKNRLKSLSKIMAFSKKLKAEIVKFFQKLFKKNSLYSSVFF